MAGSDKLNKAAMLYHAARAKKKPKPEAEETPADEAAETPEQQAAEAAAGTEEHPALVKKLKKKK